MQNIRTVVFDIGETLVDEGRLWRLWAERLDVPEHSFFAVLGAVIDGRRDHRSVFEYFRPGFDLAAARQQLRDQGILDCIEAGDFYPDAVPCLHALRKLGLNIGIAGNQPSEIEAVLNGMKLPVDFIAASQRWGVNKPSTAFFERVIDEVGAPPETIAYVGDRVDNDVLPSAAAGMFAVFLRRGPWGYLHANWPEAAHANLRIDNLNELPAALESAGKC